MKLTSMTLINISMSKKAGAPIKNDNWHKMDATPEVVLENTAYYQSLIGVLRWIIELGSFDIVCEVSMMSPCLA